MNVRVLFFGATADEAGRREMEIEVGPGATSGDAFEKVFLQYPRLLSHKLLFAVNQEYSDRSELLKENDELAVFTAVSGG